MGRTKFESRLSWCSQWSESFPPNTTNIFTPTYNYMHQINLSIKSVNLLLKDSLGVLHKKTQDDTKNCQHQNCPLVGNFGCINHQDCLPYLIFSCLEPCIANIRDYCDFENFLARWKFQTVMTNFSMCCQIFSLGSFEVT